MSTRVGASGAADGLTRFGQWIDGEGRPYELFDEPEARRRDAAGQEYYVLFGEPDRWRAYLRVTDRHAWYKSTWLDPEGREVYSHLFVPGSKYGRDHSWRFLEQVTVQEYLSEHPPRPFPLGDNRLVLKAYFNADGSGVARRHESGQLLRAELPIAPELVGDGGPSILWEPTPEFGDWASIMRRDRDVR